MTTNYVPRGGDVGEPVTQGIFFDQMNVLREEMKEYHRRSGLKFDELSRKLEEHSVEDDAVADRVLVIETQRGLEKTSRDETAVTVMEAVNRRILIVGILASAIIPIVLKIIDHVTTAVVLR